VEESGGEPGGLPLLSHACAADALDPSETEDTEDTVDCYDMVAWSSNSRYVAVGRVGEDSSGVRTGRQRIIVWDARNGRTHVTVDIRPQHEGFSDIFGIALSPDGGMLLVTRELSTTVTEVWDAQLLRLCGFVLRHPPLWVLPVGHVVRRRHPGFRW
jgi:hypothetical protein